MARTVLLAPPKPQRSRKTNKPGSPQKGEPGSWLRDNRTEIAPYLAAWFYLLAVLLLAKTPYALPGYWAVSGLISGSFYLWGNRLRALRQFTARPKDGKPRSRAQRSRLAYILAAPGVPAGWASWATWGHVRPSLWDCVVYVCLVTLAAGPWLLYLRSDKKIRLVLDGMDREDEAQAILDAKTVINDWVGFVAACGLSGAKLKRLTFTRHARMITITMRRGSTTMNFTPLRMNRIENASLWDLATGMTRIDRNPTLAREITIRYMLEDPHAGSLEPPEFEDMADDVITLGLFEDARTVMFEWVNTLIAGMTRAGKSGVINTLIRAFAKIPHVAILGIDLKPGAPELGPWESVMAALAKDEFAADQLLEDIKRGLNQRGRIMERHGWKTWRVTKRAPFMVLVIDEIHVMPLAMKRKVAEVAALCGAFGMIVIVATQYPIKATLPSEVKQNLDQRIGLRTADTTADRVVFGDQATRTGWTPSLLCPVDRKGSFLIRNGMPGHGRPVLARGWWVDEAQVERDSDALSRHRAWILGEHPWAEEIEDGDDQEEIQEAEVLAIEQISTEDLILDAIRAGHTSPKAIAEYTEIPDRTVKWNLARLKSNGRVEQPIVKGPYRIPFADRERV